MQYIRYRFTVSSLAILSMATNGFAQQSAPPAGAAQIADAPASGQYVPIEDYRALKRELDELKLRVDAQDKKLAETTAPTTQPAAQSPFAQTAAAPNANGQSGSSLLLPAGNTVDQALKTLFAARAEKEYFSPFGVMNPAHMRADLPMQIGSWQDMNLYIGLQTVGRYQGLQQQNVSLAGVHQHGLDPGFQDPFANLSFLATISDKFDIYFDTYVASRPHANTMYGHEGYLLFKGLPAPFDAGQLSKAFDYINVKVGAFDLDFGDDNYRRSNNARVQRNPLIGNPLVDPNVEEIGGEIYSVKGPVYWLFGLGSGTTTEHFDYGSEPSVHGKLWAYPFPDLRTSVSAYHVDLSGSVDTSYLYTNGRSGGAFAGVFGGGDNPGQILPQAGKDVTAVEGDVTWNRWPFELYSNLGWVQDGDINGPANGSPSERWIYGAIEPVYHFTPALFVAGRYSYAIAQSVNGVDTNGWVDRAEVGGGYWITNNLLGKVEYVYQQYHNFGLADGVVSGVDSFNSPRFNGILLEMSFSF